jgi:galactoside O-acetyltransferase
MNYSESELKEIFGSVGKNVRVDKSCALFGAERIHLGSNVRIDCQTLLSAGEKGIVIGDNVHIAVWAGLFGASGAIAIESFCGISVRATLFTGTDDFAMGFLTNPTIPAKYRRVKNGDVVLRKHALVGCGAVVMPVTLGVAAAVGALSFVNKDVGEFEIVSGRPAVKVGMRHPRILDLERQFLDEQAAAG